MENSVEIKKVVRDKYAEIANKSKIKSQSSCGCCGTGNIVKTNYSVFNDNYDNLDGYVAEADLNLGCGLPTEYAGINIGNTVVDLGSGAGNDVFVSRALVGNEGRVIGIDFTEEMISKAEMNNDKLGFKNVEFKLGEIEKIPLEENFADVVISNCVLNLVPNKEKAFSEINRILKPNGHFCISDVVLEGEIPEGLKKSAEMYAGCISGALQKNEYLNIIDGHNFKNIEVKTVKSIILPEEVLKEHLTETQLKEFKKSNVGIKSITVVGYKN